MRWTLVATAWLLLLAASGCHAKSKPDRTKNGVRLVAGAGPRGRLEISTTSMFFNNNPARRVAWIPVCQKGFDDGTAEVMCQMLGYKYGRQYYTQKIGFPPKETSKPAGQISCYAPPPPEGTRRMLRAVATDATDATDVTATTASDLISGGGQHGSSRRSASQLLAQINTPAKSPFTCDFTIGDCDSTGPLAGVECSHVALRPAPPPPPSPPAPPPAPPPVSGSIRLVGGRSYPLMQGSVEPNLCPSAEFCEAYGRVEVEVDDPRQAGVKIWSPVCLAGLNGTLATLSQIVCQQAYDWPSLGRIPRGYVWPRVPETAPMGFPLPKGPVTKDGDFNPAAVVAWVTVLGSKAANPLKVQDLDYRVLTAPCKDQALLAIYCEAAWTRRS